VEALARKRREEVDLRTRVWAEAQAAKAARAAAAAKAAEEKADRKEARRLKREERRAAKELDRMAASAKAGAADAKAGRDAQRQVRPFNEQTSINQPSEQQATKTVRCPCNGAQLDPHRTHFRETKPGNLYFEVPLNLIAYCARIRSSLKAALEASRRRPWDDDDDEDDFSGGGGDDDDDDDDEERNEGDSDSESEIPLHRRKHYRGRIKKWNPRRPPRPIKPNAGVMLYDDERWTFLPTMRSLPGPRRPGEERSGGGSIATGASGTRTKSHMGSRSSGAVVA
jgi:hypothetical protein